MNEPKALETKITGIDTETLDGGRSQSPIVNQSPKKNVVNTITVDEVKEAVDKKQIDPKLLGTRWFLHKFRYYQHDDLGYGWQEIDFLSTYDKPITTKYPAYYLFEACNNNGQKNGSYFVVYLAYGGSPQHCILGNFLYTAGSYYRSNNVSLFCSNRTKVFDVSYPGGTIGFKTYKPRKIDLETGEMAAAEEYDSVHTIDNDSFTDTVTEL